MSTGDRSTDLGSITRVAGVRVGHSQRLDEQVVVGTLTEPGVGWATGVTVVTLPSGSAAAVDVRGGGPGTRETDLLDPVNSVRGANAIVLCGGSAYGLAAADGVMSELGRRGIGLPMNLQGDVVPIVPAAVIFDLPVGEWSARPDAAFGVDAVADALAKNDGHQVRVGTVGAGTGARAGGLKGGVGSASITFASGPARGLTIGALVVANPVGAVIDPATGLPWDSADAELFGLAGPADPGELAAFAQVAAKGTILNTTIGVIATDARLSVAATRRLAMAGHDGLARAVRPAHSPLDGDTLFAVATGGTDADPETAIAAPPGMEDDLAVLAALSEAAPVVVERAIVDAVVAAEAVGDIPAYADVLPSVFTARRS